jgi:hypothetical protein
LLRRGGAELNAPSAGVRHRYPVSRPHAGGSKTAPRAAGSRITFSGLRIARARRRFS